MDNVFDERLFEATCKGAERIGEFLEATRSALLTKDTARLREQAKVGLAAMVNHLIHQAPKHYLLSEDLKDLHRFTEKPFLDDQSSR
jgi:hypothetical protein